MIFHWNVARTASRLSAFGFALCLLGCTSTDKAPTEGRSTGGLGWAARAAVAKVEDALDGSQLAELAPIALAPYSHERVVATGSDGAAEVWVRQSEGGRRELVHTAGGETSVLAQGVATLLEGELPNGMDDNGNGLIDEAGFCVVMGKDRVSIRLSLVGEEADQVQWETVEATVALLE